MEEHLDAFYNFIVLYDLHSSDAEFSNINYEDFYLEYQHKISLAF